MRKINFLALPNKTRFKMKEPWFVYVPKSLNIFELEKKLQQASNNYLREEQQDFSYKVKDCRLWVTADSKRSFQAADETDNDQH